MGGKILVVFHSVTGNVMELAKAIAKGAGEICNVRVKRVEETVPSQILEKNPAHMRVRDELNSFPIASVEELVDYDGIIFGSPTRFGNMSSQMKTFIDKTGRLWMEKSLSGKVGGVFTSSEMLHGGKEATLFSMILPLLAHGMIIVGIPPIKELYRAGCYYGVTSTGRPKKEDLEIAKIYGRRVAEVAMALSEKVKED